MKARKKVRREMSSELPSLFRRSVTRQIEIEDLRGRIWDDLTEITGKGQIRGEMCETIRREPKSKKDVWKKEKKGEKKGRARRRH